MFTRIRNFILLKLGKTTREDLTIKTCISKGMKVGKNCHGLSACTIDVVNSWLIEIGENVTFAPQVYLLAHDANIKRHLDYTKVNFSL